MRKELLVHGVVPIPPQGIMGGVEPATTVHKKKKGKKKKPCKTRGPSRMRTAGPVNYNEAISLARGAG